MSQINTVDLTSTGHRGHSTTSGEAPLSEFRRQMREQQLRERRESRCQTNVGRGERVASILAGSALGLWGVGRRDWVGTGLALVGAAMLYRGASGRCTVYDALGIDTTSDDDQGSQDMEDGVCVTASFLINKPADKLYGFWRNFENLPQFMSHLESVEHIDDRRSHWVATAPKLYGGQVEWDAEITADEPNSLIAWRALEGSDVEHQGSIKFTPAMGDRGTRVAVEMVYRPPAGRLGRWTAKLFGEEPKQQIHDDLRNFKRMMEIGDVLTIAGQSRGNCSFLGS